MDFRVFRGPATGLHERPTGAGDRGPEEQPRGAHTARTSRYLPDLANREASPFNRTPAALPLIEDAGAGEPKHGDAADREDPRDVSSRDHLRKHRGGSKRDHHRLRARRAARTAARSGPRSESGNSAPVTRWRRTAPNGRSMTAKVICATASRVARPKKRRASSATASPSGWFRSARTWASRGERVSWSKSSRRNETSSLASSRCSRAKSG